MRPTMKILYAINTHIYIRYILKLNLFIIASLELAHIPRFHESQIMKSSIIQIGVYNLTWTRLTK
jgi:hypothetical protein